MSALASVDAAAAVADPICEEGVEQVGIPPNDEEEDDEGEVEEVVEDEDEDEEEEEEGPDPSLLVNQEWGSSAEEEHHQQQQPGPQAQQQQSEDKKPGLLELALTMNRPPKDQTPLPTMDPTASLASAANSLLPLPPLDPLLSTLEPDATAAAGSMDDRRAFNQTVNSKPRDFCPICGDRANGIHYSIYTCEGCKNFFKRSVQVLNAGRPYVCKDGMHNCNVSLYEDDGVTRRKTRCQFCRYQACLDAGMIHSGRTGVRTNNGSSAKSATNTSACSSMTNGDHFQSAASNSSSSLPLFGAEEAMDDDEEETVVCPPNAVREHDDSADLEALAQFTNESLSQEIELLQSRVRELENSLAEKDHQLQMQDGIIENLKHQCAFYARVRMPAGGGAPAAPPATKRPKLESQQQQQQQQAGNGFAGNNGTKDKITFPEGSAVSHIGNGSVTITSLKRKRELQQHH